MDTTSVTNENCHVSASLKVRSVVGGLVHKPPEFGVLLLSEPARAYPILSIGKEETSILAAFCQVSFKPRTLPYLKVALLAGQMERDSLVGIPGTHIGTILQ